MRQTQIIMGMPVTVEIADVEAPQASFDAVFNNFHEIDARFSPFRPESEVSRLNNGTPASELSTELRHVLALCDQSRRQTSGYFDVRRRGRIDPSGLVKGWAIRGAAGLLRRLGHRDFVVDAGGDIQPNGTAPGGRPWRVGIRHPRQHEQIVKALEVEREGVATSGTAARGQHIYDPHDLSNPPVGVVSLTVIGPDIYEADRFATAAFAMGRAGVEFIEQLPGFEAYQIDEAGIATYTTGFNRYVAA
jgi:thiamine biosynthesis lipoprotein